jgi:MoxR-like ATPase
MEENINQNPDGNIINPLLNQSAENVKKITDAIHATRLEIKKYLIGQDDMIDLLLVGMLANGHILLEGVPGIAKTLTAKLLAQTFSVKFSRIQFTPDLMPSDVIGTSVYNQKDGEFVFRKGPVFANIVLIDEINRAPAKTQAALFEVMEERQATYDGQTYIMQYPFLVLATQNPIEQEGTYRLPEAQLDRFIFRIKLNYPTLTEEQQILLRYKDEIKTPSLEEIQPVFTPELLNELQECVKRVKIEEQLVKYIAEIVYSTREHGKLYLGASPRASLAMIKSAKALAAIKGRDFILPDDIQYLAPFVLNHRIILTPEAEMEGLKPEDVIFEIIQKTQVPR